MFIKNRKVQQIELFEAHNFIHFLFDPCFLRLHLHPQHPHPLLFTSLSSLLARQLMAYPIVISTGKDRQKQFTQKTLLKRRRVNKSQSKNYQRNKNIKMNHYEYNMLNTICTRRSQLERRILISSRSIVLIIMYAFNWIYSKPSRLQP